MKWYKHFSEWKTAILYYLFRIVPIKKNKIVFCNYNGKGYGCNPKYIAELLRKRHPSWDYVWLSTDNNIPLPKEIRCVKYDSIKSVYELATAKIWIDNQRKLWYHRKRKEQFFIETWHGAGIPIKKIGADNPNNFNNVPYRHTSIHMNHITNLMISNSRACTKIFRKAFLYEKEILECGYPRNDLLVGDLRPYETKIRAIFNLHKNDKILLYAPTYRNSRTINPYNINYDCLIKTLEKKFGSCWKIIIRLHPSMQQKSNELCFTSAIIDGSKYDDMQELLAGCNMLLSDYSSIITEFALTRKPVFLYASDLKEYTLERAFYCEYKNLPFPISETMDELLYKILNFDLNTYKKDIESCFQKYGIVENGTAAIKIAEIIENEITS